jgi:hypothetical protein
MEAKRKETSGVRYIIIDKEKDVAFLGELTTETTDFKWHDNTPIEATYVKAVDQDGREIWTNRADMAMMKKDEELFYSSGEPKSADDIVEARLEYQKSKQEPIEKEVIHGAYMINENGDVYLKHVDIDENGAIIPMDGWKPYNPIGERTITFKFDNLLSETEIKDHKQEPIESGVYSCPEQWGESATLYSKLEPSPEVEQTATGKKRVADRPWEQPGAFNRG